MRHSAFIPPDLFEDGIGNIMVVRHKPGGRFEAGVFLLDIWCLGVKNAAFIRSESGVTLEKLFRQFYDGEPPPEQPGARGRKLVESAVAYAASLGFSPHRDYSKAARVFGGLRVADCAEEFVFGRQGRPFYVQGPHDSSETARRVLAVLDGKTGRDNYDFLVSGGLPDEDTGEGASPGEGADGEAGFSAGAEPEEVFTELVAVESGGRATPSDGLKAYFERKKSELGHEELSRMAPELGFIADTFLKVLDPAGLREASRSLEAPDASLEMFAGGVFLPLMLLWNYETSGLSEREFKRMLPPYLVKLFNEAVKFDEHEIFASMVPKLRKEEGISFFIMHFEFAEDPGPQGLRLFLILLVTDFTVRA